MYVYIYICDYRNIEIHHIVIQHVPAPSKPPPAPCFQPRLAVVLQHATTERQRSQNQQQQAQGDTPQGSSVQGRRKGRLTGMNMLSKPGFLEMGGSPGPKPMAFNTFQLSNDLDASIFVGVL